MKAGDDFDLETFGTAAFFEKLSWSVSEILTPRKPMDIVEWAENDNIYLTRDLSPTKPGKLRLNGIQKAALRRMADHGIPRMVVRKSTRIGYSMLLMILIAYTLAYRGENVLLTQPTEANAEGWMKEVFEKWWTNPIVCPALFALRRPIVRGTIMDTVAEKYLTNGAIFWARGAESDDIARRISAPVQCLDEVDAKNYLSKGKTTQGDKVDLIARRGGEFFYNKTVLGSSPTDTSISLIHKHWTRSDQGVFTIACPACGGRYALTWHSSKEREGDPRAGVKGKGFVWTTDGENDMDGQVLDVQYRCHHCAHPITQAEYIALEVDGVVEARSKPISPGFVSLDIWQAQQPTGGSWENIVQEYLKARKDNTPAAWKPFRNTICGIAYDPPTIRKFVDASSLEAKLVPFEAEVPDDVVVVTAGGDNQSGLKGAVVGSGKHERIEVSVVGWTVEERPVVIAHIVFEGRIGTPAFMARVRDFLVQSRWRRSDGRALKIMATGMDFGGDFGDAIRIFCAQLATERVWAVKGGNVERGTRTASVWPRRASSDDAKGYQWYMVDTGLAKDQIHTCLEDLLLRERRQEGDDEPYDDLAIRLPRSAALWANGQYLEGLTAEAPVLTPSGGTVWKRKVDSNTGEAWDCLIYSYAAFRGLRMMEGFADLTEVARRLKIDVSETRPEYDGEDRSWCPEIAEPDEAEIASAPDTRPAMSDKMRRYLEQKERQAAALAAPVQPAPPASEQPQFRRASKPSNWFSSRRGR